MDMQELREKAKQHGINSFGMKKEDLIQAIADAEMQGGGKAPESAKPTKVVEEQKPMEETKEIAAVETAPQIEPEQAPPMSNEMAVAMMAAKMAEEAKAMLANVAAQQTDKRSSTPEQEISNRLRSDIETIRRGEKIKIFIPGGYVGCPEYVTSVVNGHALQIKTGEEVMVPMAHYENITRAWKLKQLNAQKFKAMEQKAIQS